MTVSAPLILSMDLTGRMSDSIQRAHECASTAIRGFRVLIYVIITALGIIHGEFLCERPSHPLSCLGPFREVNRLFEISSVRGAIGDRQNNAR